MSELVNKSEVLDIWNNYWITDMTTLDAENQLRELATVELKSAPQLNENQQIVLDWLKERQLKFNERPSTTIYFLTIHYPYGLDDVAKAKKAFSKLNKPEETQVLEKFSKWAQEQEKSDEI